MTFSTDVLFKPFDGFGDGLKNRVVMAPMTRSQSPNGIPTTEVADYYRRRAEGGVGLIITEGTIIDHPASSGYPDVPHMYGEEALAGWKGVVEAVHGAGGSIIPQIWHVGSARKKGTKPNPEVRGYAPSPIPHPTHEDESEIPVGMTHQDIQKVVAAYAGAAAHALSLGFDGVEIHGAHGYLVDQFFWPGTNQREDEYGGPLENRMRFAVEIVEAVRTATTPDFPIVFRFSQWKMGNYREKLVRSPQELENFLLPLSKAGVDVFHASTRKYWKAEFKESDLNLAGWTKKISGKPTITVGSVGLDSDFLGAFMGRSAEPSDIRNLVERMERDEFDLVAVGRALIADPDWPAKIRNGRLDDIVHFTPKSLETLG